MEGGERQSAVGFRRVQVVYYLTRDGHLQHPHYVEVTLLPAQHHLRLRDVMDRLTSLRGKGMPSLYSWSCKRSYKNGYVWNDLCEDDIVHPAEGAEYVLKGSEIIDASALPLERTFQSPNVNGNGQHLSLVKDRGFHPNGGYAEPEIRDYRSSSNGDIQYRDQDRYGTAEEEFELDDGKTGSPTSPSHLSKGVCTDELDEPHTTPQQRHPAAMKGQPPQDTSSVNEPLLAAGTRNGGGSSHSVLLQLITCGSFAISKAVRDEKRSFAEVGSNRKVKSVNSDLHKAVLCKNVVRRSVEGRGGDENDDVMIRYMSENPRFGNLQSQEKEYFIGSIVESMNGSKGVNGDLAVVLKKSNSFKEEKSSMTQIGAAVVEEEKTEKVGKAKCLPRKNSCF